MTISNSPALPPDANDVHLRTDHLRSDLGVRSARGGAITLTAQFAKFVIQIGSTMILARLLTPAAYGLLAMIAVLTGFISLFRDVGLSSATVQRSDISHREVSTLFWINVGLGLVTMSIAMAAAPLLARFYQEPRVTPVTIALALTFFINGFAVQHQALLQRRMRFGALAAIEITATLASAAVAIEFARRGYGYWSLVFAQFATTLVGLAGVWVACDWRPQRPADLASVRDLVRFGRNLTGFHVVNYLSRHIDNALIGRFWGAAQLGLYDKAYQLLLLPINQISGPITAVALPALSRLADEPDAYRRAYIRILEKVVLLTTPGVILMLFVADWMVHIILGPD